LANIFSTYFKRKKVLLHRVFLLLALPSFAQKPSKIRPRPAATTTLDSKNNATAAPSFSTDSLRKAAIAKADTAKTKVVAVPDSLKKKGDLETTVVYTARDSSIIDEENRTLYLYGDAHVTYGDIKLEAEYITLNWLTNQVVAIGKVDSTTKEKIGFPVFLQEGTEYNADTITYNFKSRKGFIKNIITTQDGGYIQGKKVKKDADDNMYLVNATYTTCDLAHPHFNILATKIKMVNGKKGNKSIIAGPFTMLLNDVPLPFKFPFGFFPMLQNKENGRSGVLFPTYGEEPRGRGFFLRDGGYYFAINDRVTSALTGDIYSKGGWGVGLQTMYAKRYRYSGALNFKFNLNKTGDEYDDRVNDPAKDFMLSWNHSPVSRGNSSFSANVSLQSNGFGTRNAQNTQNYLQSTSNSSVSYSRTFPNIGNFSSNVRINQNMVTGVYQGGLGLNLGVNQVQPFKRKNAVTSAWYESFRVGFSMDGTIDLSNDIRNQQSSGLGEYRIYNTYIEPIRNRNSFDQAYNLDPYYRQKVGVNILENWNTIKNQSQPRINYSIPISLPNFKFFKYFNFTPSVSLQGNVYTKKLTYSNITENDTLYVKIDTTQNWSFNPYQTYSFNSSINTRFYGTVRFKKGRTQAIRHTVAPNISFSYTPDFSDPSKGYFQDVRINTRGDIRRLSRFVGGSSTVGEVGLISFSLANTLEAKRKAKSDTAKKESEKINLLDNLNFNTSYNILADSFNLQPISVNANTRLFKKFDINAAAVFDPYLYDKSDPFFYNPNLEYSAGRRVNQYKLSNGEGLAQLNNLNLSVSTQFKPKGKDKPKTSNNASQAQMNFINKNPNLYVDFSIPWSVALSYNFNYNKTGYARSQVVQALNATGDLSLTEKWKISYGTGYDFVSKALTYTNIGIHRDLHCWDMNINWVPVAYGGRGGMFSFEIRARSSILQELKLSKRGSPTGYVNY
jgi:lipopolysaccharide assembly outer membrane protein LptD (OstA)